MKGDIWIIEGKKRKLLKRKQTVYVRQASESELAEEVRQAIRHGADDIILERQG